MMKGYKTLAVNAATVVLMALLTWVAGVDWTQYVSPSWAMIILGAANMGLRLITTTPVGKSA
jgi:hypothetical protein